MSQQRELPVDSNSCEMKLHLHEASFHGGFYHGPTGGLGFISQWPGPTGSQWHSIFGTHTPLALHHPAVALFPFIELLFPFIVIVVMLFTLFFPSITAWSIVVPLFDFYLFIYSKYTTRNRQLARNKLFLNKQ